MIRHFLCLWAIILPFFAQAQLKFDKFSENPTEFSLQLKEFLTASKREDMEKLYADFSKQFLTFSPEELTQIVKTSNKMLSYKMTAIPYFSDYLRCLQAIRNKSDGNVNTFKVWHTIVDTVLVDIENRRFKPIQDFLAFSHAFLDRGALRAGEGGGVSWIARGKMDLRYENKMPVVVYEKLDLICQRKQDSIMIQNTSGTFYPIEQLWKGKGGKVTWERFEKMKDVYAEIEDYQFEMKKSSFEVAKATLYYPSFFPEKPIKGSFEDKLVVENKATEGSYPRFKSFDKIIKINDIGGGVQFLGGFRLEGTTIYGYGSKDSKAHLKIINENGKKVFRGEADLFVIRKGERVVGERVEAVIYFEQDSIYHPSVNIRYDVDNRALHLLRGDKPSDRNPFYASFHKLNINSERIDCYFKKDSILIGEKKGNFAAISDKAVFESFNYFDESDYRRIQNIASTNPIAILKAMSSEQKTTTLDANAVAQQINAKLDATSINNLLFDLVSQGFINYDFETKKIEVKEKTIHYADAAMKKSDYDPIKIVSDSTKTANAVLNVKDKKIAINGVNNVVLSQKRRVAIEPSDKFIEMEQNRDMDFKGKLFTGFARFQGKKFHFDYDKFQIEMDSARYFDLFLPSGDKGKDGKPVALSIGSRLEYVSGVMIIDAPNNKSGREDILMFPSMNTKQPAYIFYDAKETLEGCYKRDSFYFKLDKFSLNNMDKLSKDNFKFKGTLISGGIFPDFLETVALQEDHSLGFTTKSPAGGYPIYGKKGLFNGEMSLSNKGFFGKGLIKYLGSSTESEDIVFKPKQMTASAKLFNMSEDRSSPVKVPEIKGLDVKIDWRPYKDSMYVTTKDKPFALFKANNHTLTGTLILTPIGARGRGVVSWDKGVMTSKLFSFAPFSVLADTMDLKIRALDKSEAIAIDTRNVKGTSDFDAQIGSYKANSDVISTVMPFNQYKTSMNEFKWDMKGETITFEADDKKLAVFQSIHPDQDSLFFSGKTAFYNLKNNELKIGGVPFIPTCDALIYTEKGDIEIKEGGLMTTLNNARIVADTSSRYHVINRATVDVKGKKLYTAKGFYEYNIGERKQEILFSDIVGQRVGKGQRAEKRTETRATGEIKEEDNFYIDKRTKFKGKISLYALSPNLTFEGFAQLDAPLLPAREWFTMNDIADKNDLAISYDTPKRQEGDPLRSGLFLSKENGVIYPALMMVLGFRKDRAIFEGKGLLKLNKTTDEFITGDSIRISKPQAKRGNYMSVSNKDGKVKVEGTLNIGSGLKYVKITAAGNAETAFLPPVDTLNVYAQNYKVTANVMAGLEAYIPDKLLNMVINDFRTVGLELPDVEYSKDLLFYEKALTSFIDDDNDWAKAAFPLKERALDLTAKHGNKFALLFSQLPLKWNADYQSFITTKDQVGLSAIKGEKINKTVTAFIEFKMPSNEDDRVYIYLKSPSEFFYFFGYQAGIMSVGSNNPKFTEAFNALKKDEKARKMPDGESYEIQDVSESTAEMFVRRVKNGRNTSTSTLPKQ